MYPNPMNDFYLRQAQPYQQSFNFPPYEPQIVANWVTSLEEARSAQMNIVSTNLYLDTSSGKIYLKRMGDNGKPQFLSYVVEEEIVKDPMQEINNRLTKIEQYLGGRNDKSISSNAGSRQSPGLFDQTASRPYESNDEAESTGVSENAGNDFWQN